MGSKGRIRAAIEPPPRLVDWSLFAFVCFEVATGLVSFTVGVPEGWPIFWAHRIAGLTIVALLAFKLARVRHRLLDPGEWRPSTALSVLTAVAALGALSTGIVWVLGLDIRLSYWTLLSVHVGFGLALVPLLLAHVKTRFRRPRRADFEGRRTALRYGALLAAGAATYRAQEAAAGLFGTAGAARRFTGSQPRTGSGNRSFPITSWVADDPDPIDRGAWRLSVDGLVGDPIELEYDALAAAGEAGAEGGEAGEFDDPGDAGGGTLDADELRALLDCTSGWYTVQEWGGVRVGELLEAAGGVGEGAAWVRFVSVTGYRWSLPLAEAREALLATRVGGEPLSHGHGAPLRLVAPGRRGFQWVKWVERVEVRAEGDPAQWLVTLISGFE